MVGLPFIIIRKRGWSKVYNKDLNFKLNIVYTFAGWMFCIEDFKGFPTARRTNAKQLRITVTGAATVDQ